MKTLYLIAPYKNWVTKEFSTSIRFLKTIESFDFFATTKQCYEFIQIQICKKIQGDNIEYGIIENCKFDSVLRSKN